MTYKSLKLEDLSINSANDRHGELENETAAIAWLFNTNETHMRNLAKDIVSSGQVYEPPLVHPAGAKYIVFDGNRRTTCLKLIHNPKRAPTVELRDFFEELKKKAADTLERQILCQIENDREEIDEILLRRHTGSQGGIGRSNWDDRMKSNFINRTGQGTGHNLAGEVEKRLAASDKPKITKKIPWSTLNRLLSAEVFRNRVGFKYAKGKFEFTHEEPVVIHALYRIADDLANKRIVLGDIWDIDGKCSYLDELEAAGVLPTDEHLLSPPKLSSGPAPDPEPQPKPKPTPTSPPPRRTKLIPSEEFGIAWPGRLQRLHSIWEELQFRLDLRDHPNAISVLFRVLLELSIENYIEQTRLTTIQANDTLAKRALKVAEDMRRHDRITAKYLEVFGKFKQYDSLVSADTLNKYVHSQNFAPSPEHLTAIWDTLSEFIVKCVKA